MRTTLLLSDLNAEVLLESSCKGKFLLLSLKPTGVVDEAPGVGS